MHRKLREEVLTRIRREHCADRIGQQRVKRDQEDSGRKWQRKERERQTTTRRLQRDFFAVGFSMDISLGWGRQTGTTSTVRGMGKICTVVNGEEVTIRTAVGGRKSQCRWAPWLTTFRENVREGLLPAPFSVVVRRTGRGPVTGHEDRLVPRAHGACPLDLFGTQ